MTQTAAVRKRLPAAERRELIVEAAGLAFGERGYDGAQMDEIAAAAGVTKPILYRHFSSKQALYLALLKRHAEDLPTFTEQLPQQGEPRELMRTVLDGWLDYVEAHSYSWQMLFRDSGGGPEIAAQRQQVHARAREVLVELIGALASSQVPRRELLPLAELMSMGMASLVLWWMETPGVEREAVLDALTRSWTSLLSA